MTLHLEASRAVPVPFETACARVVPMPLTEIFSRRYAAIAPIVEVRDQDGEWATAGQQRTIVLGDGGQLQETLTAVDTPDSFEYDITVTKGPNRFLISGVHGRWSFVPSGDGTLITWSWDLTPARPSAKLVLPIFARMWAGYARQALEQIEKILLNK